MLRVELFGPGRAFFNDQPIANFPHRHFFLLFCYLLLNLRHPLLRDQLAAVFWGDFPVQPSRKNLRNALWKLRQVLESAGATPEDYLLVNDESVSFIQSSAYDLDVERFERVLTAFQDVPGEQLTPAQANELEKTIELYVGDLLEGVYEDWAIYDRERLHLLYLTTLSKLIAFHEVYGHYERGLAYGERILVRDNTREHVHLQMMRLYWLAGNRPAALAQYRRCAQILREELNILPMRETSAVYQQMIHNQYPALHAAPVPPLAAPETNAVPPLVNENLILRLQRLQQVIEDTRIELSQLEALLARPYRLP
jgi:DNA-binding SARP family transcriptional activator